MDILFTIITVLVLAGLFVLSLCSVVSASRSVWKHNGRGWGILASIVFTLVMAALWYSFIIVVGSIMMLFIFISIFSLLGA